MQDNYGKTHVLRSNLEIKLANILNEYDAIWDYEITTIPYIIPESDHKYTIDFTLNNGVYIEGKGYLSDHAERRKYVLLKQQHPELDLRFVFDNGNKLCGGTKMSHNKWAEKYNFKHCDIKDVDQIKAWVNEDTTKE